jgi:hypothetical protein
VQEENGGYFADILDLLKKDPFLALTLPWGELSVLKDMHPHKSDDGAYGCISHAFAVYFAYISGF